MRRLRFFDAAMALGTLVLVVGASAQDRTYAYDADNYAEVEIDVLGMGLATFHRDGVTHDMSIGIGGENPAVFSGITYLNSDTVLIRLRLGRMVAAGYIFDLATWATKTPICVGVNFIPSPDLASLAFGEFSDWFALILVDEIQLYPKITTDLVSFRTHGSGYRRSAAPESYQRDYIGAVDRFTNRLLSPLIWTETATLEFVVGENFGHNEGNLLDEEVVEHPDSEFYHMTFSWPVSGEAFGVLPSSMTASLTSAEIEQLRAETIVVTRQQLASTEVQAAIDALELLGR